MQDLEIELAIGETIVLDDCVLTLLDVEGDAICFRIESCAGAEELAAYPPPAK